MSSEILTAVEKLVKEGATALKWVEENGITFTTTTEEKAVAYAIKFGWQLVTGD